MSYARKKPYISTDYEKMRSTRMDSEMYNPNSPQRVESEFKKPYLYDEHPKSEQTYTPPGGFIPVEPPPWTPPGTGGDCKPTGDAVGGGPDPCEPGQSCGQWVFYCAHKITNFTAVGGKIESVRHQSNDTVVVTACWDESTDENLTVTGWNEDGEVASTSFEKDECCKETDGDPIITYTTQQMALNGTQDLYASDGSGGPYNWSLTSGIDPGTLSTTTTVSGAPVTYTAPSSNDGCLNNSTIQVEDRCGNSVTLKIAFDQYGGYNAAVRSFIVGSGCSMYIGLSVIKCNGDESIVGGGFFCATCCLLSGVCRAKLHYYAACNVTDPTPCTETALVEACKNLDYPTCSSSICDLGVHDERPPEWITLGCCPWQLL